MAFGFDALISQLAAAYETETGQATPFSSGELALHDHAVAAAVPRVVFTHRGGTHEPPQRDAAHQMARDEAPLVSVALEVLRAECVADTDENADQLWLNICALLRNSYGDAVELTTIEWLTQQNRVASHGITTSVKCQDFRFRRPVSSVLIPLGGPTPPWGAVEVKTTDHVVTLDPDDLTGCGHATPDVPWEDP